MPLFPGKDRLGLSRCCMGFVLGALLSWLLYHLRHKHSFIPRAAPPPADGQSRLGQVMGDLARSYFKSEWLASGFTREHFESLAGQCQEAFRSREATMVVQVIGGAIYVDRSGWKTAYPWDVLRAHFILGKLQQLLDRKPLGDFEFILNTHDCPMRRITEGPYFSITKCDTVDAIPLPQWYRWRDGAFGNWDKKMDRTFFNACSLGWPEKTSRAVFRGALRRSSLQLQGGSLTFIDITKDNWRTASRSKLFYLASQHPDLLDVGVSKESGNEGQEEVLEAMGWTPKDRLSMEDQARIFKYVVYIEGACGWADRLKNLLAAGLVVFLQDTPCREFFQPLLQPWVHYIPVRNDLDDLVERIRWAVAHDEEAQEIGANAAEFARTYLSQEAWDVYMEAVLTLYSGMQAYPVKRRRDSDRFVGSSKCHLNRSFTCDDHGSFAGE